MENDPKFKVSTKIVEKLTKALRLSPSHLFELSEEEIMRRLKGMRRNDRKHLRNELVNLRNTAKMQIINQATQNPKSERYPNNAKIQNLMNQSEQNSKFERYSNAAEMQNIMNQSPQNSKFQRYPNEYKMENVMNQTAQYSKFVRYPNDARMHNIKNQAAQNQNFELYTNQEVSDDLRGRGGDDESQPNQSRQNQKFERYSNAATMQNIRYPSAQNSKFGHYPNEAEMQYIQNQSAQNQNFEHYPNREVSDDLRGRGGDDESQPMIRVEVPMLRVPSPPPGIRGRSIPIDATGSQGADASSAGIRCYDGYSVGSFEDEDDFCPNPVLTSTPKKEIPGRWHGPNYGPFTELTVYDESIDLDERERQMQRDGRRLHGRRLSENQPDFARRKACPGNNRTAPAALRYREETPKDLRQLADRIYNPPQQCSPQPHHFDISKFKQSKSIELPVSDVQEDEYDYNAAYQNPALGYRISDIQCDETIDLPYSDEISQMSPEGRLGSYQSPPNQRHTYDHHQQYPTPQKHQPRHWSFPPIKISTPEQDILISPSDQDIRETLYETAPLLEDTQYDTAMDDGTMYETAQDFAQDEGYQDDTCPPQRQRGGRSFMSDFNKRQAPFNAYVICTENSKQCPRRRQ